MTELPFHPFVFTYIYWPLKQQFSLLLLVELSPSLPDILVQLFLPLHRHHLPLNYSNPRSFRFISSLVELLNLLEILQ